MSGRRALPAVAPALALAAACGPAGEPEWIDFAERLPVAEAVVPEGRPPPRVADEVLHQPPGARITWGVPVPADARLRGEAALADDAPSGDGRARVVVSVQSALGEEREVVAADVDPSADVDVDLSDLAGRLALVHVTLEGGPGVEWRGLGIAGRRHEPDAPELPRRLYHVLIVVLDSLRADHLEPYGAEDVETPNLRKLAESGVVFPNARTPSSWTRPAVGALLTSLPPASLGIESLEHALPDSPLLLPHILKRAGYRTLAVTRSAMVSPRTGLGGGFDDVQVTVRSEEGRFEADTSSNPEAMAGRLWVRRLGPLLRSPEEPGFVYLHELDPHSPYGPPSPYAALYGVEGAEWGPKPIWLRDARRNPAGIDPDEVATLRALYRGEVSFMDAYVGAVVRRLEEEGLRDDTLVVVLSDHGEEFLDHGGFGHGHTVYEELLRIPLLMSLPGVLPGGRRPEVHASIEDVAPTILDLLGIDPPAAMRGRSLLPFLAAPDDYRPPRASLALSMRFEKAAIRFGRWKLVREGRPEEGPARHRLFDLRSDPAETRDVAAEHPVVAGALRQMLALALRRAEADRLEPEVTELDPESSEALRALGYVE